MTIRFGTIFGSKNGVPPYQDNPKGERRSQERIGERQKVRFFSPDSRSVHEGIWINGSDGGAFIETNDTLPLLTVIRIEAPGLVCQARVCRVHWLRPDERSQRSSGMAVKLITAHGESSTSSPTSTATSSPAKTAAGGATESVALPLRPLLHPG